MTRRDTYMDALLRHLGAVSYEALHGRTSGRRGASARRDRGEPDRAAAHRRPGRARQATPEK